LCDKVRALSVTSRKTTVKAKLKKVLQLIYAKTQVNGLIQEESD
jgi:hypothetical protein